ncbi:MAG TPA: methyltransferase domain-containing protein [Stellaceae bacterium]|nr:methyltransferase domain-containing protein [Stellaceae bacterium]
MIAAVDAEKLRQVKQRKWFYEFELPDGSVTETSVPKFVTPIHTTRSNKLREVIGEYVPDCCTLTALDLGSNEGFFSIELARHFARVRGYDVRRENIRAAELITDVLGVRNIEYRKTDLTRLSFSEEIAADFVLAYGVAYHFEDPIRFLRLASKLARKHILVETQVFPYRLGGLIEGGHYNNMRPLHGMFALVGDVPSSVLGGTSDLQLVPSLDALLFLLEKFGFRSLRLLEFGPDDYEQYVRGSRVIVYGQK